MLYICHPQVLKIRYNKRILTTFAVGDFCRFAVSSTEAHWELSTLAHKLKNKRDHLKEQLEKCYQLIGK